MKLLIPLLFLLFYVKTTCAQKIRFSDTTNEWTYMYSNPFNGPLPPNFHYFTYKGDTTIKNIKYQRLHDSLILNYIMYVREDTLQERVYYFNLHDSSEKILFDFNFKVADTFGYSESCPIILGSLDSFRFNGISHKIQNFPVTVFEGIGSWDEMFSINCRHPDMWTKLICFRTRGQNVTIRHPSGGYYLTSDWCSLNVNNATYTGKVLLYPDPANEETKMIFPYTITGRLDISNTLGQLIVQTVLNNAKEVSFRNVINTQGIYYYKISDVVSGNNFTGKFVYQ